MSETPHLAERLPDVFAAGDGHHASHPIAAALEVRDGAVVTVLTGLVAL